MADIDLRESERKASRKADSGMLVPLPTTEKESAVSESPLLNIPSYTPPTYEEVLDAHALTILAGGADFSIENGDLALTKDGDIKLGDTVHNALFRVVQAWRYNAPHLRMLFELEGQMRARKIEMDDKANAIGAASQARFSVDFPAGDEELITAYHTVIDEQGAAQYGQATYAGCVILLLSGLMRRFKDDVEATEDDWTKAAPLFNGYSVGQLLVASANGFRHEDEWAKTRQPTTRQQASQTALAKALGGIGSALERKPGRCSDVLDLLSGGDFDRLSEHLFSFAHNIAVRRRAKP